MIKSSSYRSSIVENDSCCITHNSFHNLSYLRGSVEIEAAFVLDVEHQVASIQVLHYKEEVLLCKNTLLSAHCHRQVRHEECVRKWIQIRGTRRSHCCGHGWFSIGEHACKRFTSTVDAQYVCAYFRLECGVEVCEEGVLPGEGQHSFLDHGTLYIIIHEDYILLQNLDSKVLPLPLQFCQQHLRCQKVRVRASSPVSWSTIPSCFWCSYINLIVPQ